MNTRPKGNCSEVSGESLQKCSELWGGGALTRLRMLCIGMNGATAPWG